MDKIEFAKVMAYIQAATQKLLPRDSVEVYFDLLGDLPLDVLKLAAKRVVLEHRWATFPSVAEIREAAVETMLGDVPTAAEAWMIARRLVDGLDLDPIRAGQNFVKDGTRYESQWAAVTDCVLPLIVESITAFGIRNLCCGREPLSLQRTQFMKIYEQLATKESRTALFPESVKQAITVVSEKNRQIVNGIAKQIGSETHVNQTD